jgi:hypothetical protein
VGDPWGTWRGETVVHLPSLPHTNLKKALGPWPRHPPGTECIHVYVHAIHSEHDPGREREQGGKEEDEVGNGRVTSPSHTLVYTQAEAAIPANPTTALIPLSSAPRTRMVGSHCCPCYLQLSCAGWSGRVLLRPHLYASPKHDTKAPPHLSTHWQTIGALPDADHSTPKVSGMPKMNAPKHGHRWRGFSVGMWHHGCPRVSRRSCDFAPCLNLRSNV